ncbi:MAG: Ig-like domain-containing protein [Candidatus Sericytochromatia bacterium]|nr:Ig-like domain-containing protein [Candidatus Sericytochromatia bacterium]
MPAALCNIHRASVTGQCARCKTRTCVRCGQVGKTCSFCREGVIQAIEIAQEEADDCVNHERIKAVAGCPSCRRRFCSTCLNTQGTCFPCAQRAIDRAVQQDQKTKSLEGRLKRQRQKRRRTVRRVAIVAGAMILLVLGSVIYRGRLPFFQAADPGNSAVLAPQPVYDQEAQSGRSARIWKAPTERTRGQPVAGLPPAPGIVALARPGAGAIVSGRTVVDARIAQGTAQRVEFFVDGTWLGVSDHAPHQFVWDTRAHGRGSARLELVAYGFDGSARRSAVVTVQVAN